MKTYFVYLNRVVRDKSYQWRIAVTQNYENLQGVSRDQVPAIWKVPNCHSTEEAKGKVLMYKTFPSNVTREGISSIR
jgi:hypothetical protein